MSSASFWDSLEIVVSEGDAADDKKPVKVMTLKFEQRVATYRKAGLTYPKSLAKAVSADPTGYSMWVERGGDASALEPKKQDTSAAAFLEQWLTYILHDGLSRGVATLRTCKENPEAYNNYFLALARGEVEDIADCELPSVKA